MSKNVLVQLDGDESRLLAAFRKSEGATKKLEGSLGKLGSTGATSGKQIADAMIKAAQSGGREIDQLIKQLHGAGGESRKLAATMSKELKNSAIQAEGGMDGLINKIGQLDPKLKVVAEGWKADMIEANRRVAGSFADPLEQLEKLGPEASEVASKIRQELTNAGRIGEAALRDMLSPLDQADANVSRVSRTLLREAQLASTGGQSAFARFGQSAVAQIGAAASAYIGVNEAIGLVTSSIENQLRVIDEARQANMTLAEAQASARKNLNVADISADQRKFLLDENVQNISAAFKIDDLGSITKAVGDAVSSGANFRETIGAVRTSAALNVLSPSDIDETAAAIVKVQKSTGITNPQVAADKILSTGSMSQVVDPARLFRNLPPAMQSGKQFSMPGMEKQGALESAAIFAALSKAAGDDQGESSKTATITLNAKTREFFKDIGAKTAEARKDLSELTTKDPLSATQRQVMSELVASKTNKATIDTEIKTLVAKIESIQSQQDAGNIPAAMGRTLAVDKRTAKERLTELRKNEFTPADEARLKQLEEQKAETLARRQKEVQKLEAKISFGQLNGQDISKLDPGSPLSRVDFIRKNNLFSKFSEVSGSFGEQGFLAGIENLLTGGDIAGIAGQTNQMLQGSGDSTGKFDQTVADFKDTTKQLSVAIANKSASAATQRQASSDALGAIDSTVRKIVTESLADTQRRGSMGIYDSITETGLGYGVGLKGSPGPEEAVSGAMKLAARRYTLRSGGVTPEEKPLVSRLTDDIGTLTDNVLGGTAISGSSRISDALSLAKNYRDAGQDFNGTPTGMRNTMNRFGVSAMDVTVAKENPELVGRMVQLLERQLELQSQMLSEQQITTQAAQATASNTSQDSFDPSQAQAVAAGAR